VTELLRIALIGPRAAGKSTIGARLATRMHLPFFDLDLEIERRHGASTSQLLRNLGEAKFRELELEALSARIGSRAEVLATGGGVLSTAEARALLAKHYRCLLVIAPAAVLAERIRHGGGAETRPALRGADPADEVAELLRERMPLYLQAASAMWSSAAATPEEIATEMQRYLLQNA
jgi:shikimate kinase